MGFELCQHPLQNELVNECVNRMKDAQEEEKVALAKAKDDMAQ